MNRRIVSTLDGSKTIYLKDWDEHYHSKHGAIQESNHVFINQGLLHIDKSQIAILEIGFGTGLNALMTWMAASEKGYRIEYVGVDAFPITIKELEKLNYITLLEGSFFEDGFRAMHIGPHNEELLIADNFKLCKLRIDFMKITDENRYDLIYFDAFGPMVQPELWTTILFKKMFKSLSFGGVLVTYSAKGSVRRNMMEVGFTVERLPGPPGKREMLRATKK